MAMKQRSGGISATLPGQSVRSVYENFQPISERKEDEGSTILLVHLPGLFKSLLLILYSFTNLRFNMPSCNCLNISFILVVVA